MNHPSLKGWFLAQNANTFVIRVGGHVPFAIRNSKNPKLLKNRKALKNQNKHDVERKAWTINLLGKLPLLD